MEVTSLTTDSAATASRRPCICLSIAGSDPSGGAGIQADLKTFSALGCYGAAAVTALTVQNTLGVEHSHFVPASLVYDQAAAVMEDLQPAAVKIGMTGTKETIAAIARLIDTYAPPFVVLDPVMASTSGHSLLKEGKAPFEGKSKETRGIVDMLLEELVPRSTLLTPNLPELFALCGAEVSPLEGVRWLHDKAGCPNVLVKGGHREGEPEDLLCARGEVHTFGGVRIDTPNTHGTGCTLSSAIAAYAARGCTVPEAVGRAKEYIQKAIESGAAVRVGRGKGPVNHFFSPEQLIIK